MDAETESWLDALVASGLVPQHIIDLERATQGILLQERTGDPPIEEPDPMKIELPSIPTLKGTTCSFCGEETVMDIHKKRKPCLTCGTVNT